MNKLLPSADEKFPTGAMASFRCDGAWNAVSQRTSGSETLLRIRSLAGYIIARRSPRFPSLETGAADSSKRFKRHGLSFGLIVQKEPNTGARLFFVGRPLEEAVMAFCAALEEWTREDGAHNKVYALIKKKNAQQLKCDNHCVFDKSSPIGRTVSFSAVSKKIKG